MLDFAWLGDEACQGINGRVLQLSRAALRPFLFYYVPDSPDF